MKQFRFSLAIVALMATSLVYAGNFGSTSNVSVQSTSGITVEVRVAEIVKAYSHITSKTSMNVFLENDDQTVTVLNPTLNYAGRLHRIANYSSPDHFAGVCKYFKLKDFKTYSADYTVEPLALIFAKDGQVRGPSYLSGWKHSVLEWITCSK